MEPPLTVECAICRHSIVEPVDLADCVTHDAKTKEQTVHLAHGECARRADPEKKRWSYAG